VDKLLHGEQSLRLDRWLWYARFYKTRIGAAEAVTGGHVRVNGERARPAHRIRPGDDVELVKHQLKYRFTVTGIPTRRGPAREAQSCYAEDPDSVAARERRIAQLRIDRRQMPMTPGRPDKHTRRKLRARNRDPGQDR